MAFGQGSRTRVSLFQVNTSDFLKGGGLFTHSFAFEWCFKQAIFKTNSEARLQYTAATQGCQAAFHKGWTIIWLVILLLWIYSLLLRRILSLLWISWLRIALRGVPLWSITVSLRRRHIHRRCPCVVITHVCLLACLLTLDFRVFLVLVLLKCFTDLRYNKKDIPRRPLKLPKFEPIFYSESNTRHFRLSIFINPCFQLRPYRWMALQTARRSSSCVERWCFVLSAERTISLVPSSFISISTTPPLWSVSQSDGRV
jgi:hypothetical protein